MKYKRIPKHTLQFCEFIFKINLENFITQSIRKTDQSIAIYNNNTGKVVLKIKLHCFTNFSSKINYYKMYIYPEIH